MFPDINEALGKFQHILEQDDECGNLFLKNPFRVSYRRGHKNLKELIAPSKIALPDHFEERENSKRQYQGKCVKCGGVVNLLEVGNDVQVYTHAKCQKKIQNLKVFKPEECIRLDKI